MLLRWQFPCICWRCPYICVLSNVFLKFRWFISQYCFKLEFSRVIVSWHVKNTSVLCWFEGERIHFQFILLWVAAITVHVSFNGEIRTHLFLIISAFIACKVSTLSTLLQKFPKQLKLALTVTLEWASNNKMNGQVPQVGGYVWHGPFSNQ